MKTFKPLLAKIIPKEEAEMPLPREETTPPVTKINLVFIRKSPLNKNNFFGVPYLVYHSYNI